MTGLALADVSRIGSIVRADFHSHFLRPRRPVVLADLPVSWPALHKWTPQYLSDRYGARPVNVYDASFAAPGRHYMASLQTMPFGEFLQAILTTPRDLRMFLYNLAREIPELLDDIRFPDLAEGFSRRFVFTFFGCRGSVTPIHYDIDYSHVFYTALCGRRRVILFPASESARLYRHPFTVRSYIDANRPDFARFPALRKARGCAVTVQPGETLFIPSGWWHEVSYVDGGYGIALRCPSERWSQRLCGYGNLLLMSPLDRLLNKLFPNAWFNWKESIAAARAGAQ